MAEVLLTGFPGFIARRLFQKLVEAGDNVSLLVRHRYQAEGNALIARTQGPGSGRVLVGDVALMDLGLTGPEVRNLLREVEVVYHTATVQTREGRPQDAWTVNVDGTRSVVELALGADRLTRFAFLSSAFVSGDRRGVVLEEELERSQAFRTQFERAKFEAEKILRRVAADMPVSVFRPSLIVGDSQTGEFDQTDDPYHMMLRFLNVPFNINVPLPGRGDYPLNIVPVDYVVSAMSHITRDPRGVGRTFHLTDPNPLPARRVLELLAEHGNRRRPWGTIPAPLARRLLKLPIINRLGPPPRVVDHFNRLVIYNNTNTLELLGGTELQCPPFESYVSNLVAHLQRMGGDSRENRYA
ncbi:MAG: thioester reductase-like protein [Myxococcota bacterium]|jgi:thioester reductase-like protein